MAESILGEFEMGGSLENLIGRVPERFLVNYFDANRKASANPVLQRQHQEQSIHACRDIIEHDSPACGHALKLPRRPWFHDVKETEEQKPG